VKFTPIGCNACQNTGFVSRTGIFEVLPVSNGLRHLIAENETTETIEETAIGAGMVPFRRSGMIKVAQGVTTSEELLRVIPSEYLGQEI
ncbi:MAG TPA: type II/IV secretion system protein, partial [Pirellulales bacterium]|nr:type II/IV secretion system protein [Pirellulales bacterium]